MEYTLYVSYDCGMSYNPTFWSNSFDEVQEQANKYDARNLRWYIEDEEGEHQGICTIHADILATLIHLSNKDVDGHDKSR
jgi:hypothetical protein